jgi:carbamoyl-phosphate synthase large subunit
MRSGETDVAITVKEPKLESLGKMLGEITQHPANMDVDVFFDGTDAYILEMNARFGGGYPFSHLAGVDLPAPRLSNGTRK